MFSLVQKDVIKCYLESLKIVDYNNPEIQEKARELSRGLVQVQMVKNIYHFVRDEIHHSMDAGEDKVTCRASEVLEKGHGLCFAKFNLLAALLRFMGVPTGFCYQRLVHEDGFILHGLNAVFLEGNWVRLDARGKYHDIDAQFSMSKEFLAFYPQLDGEKDYPYIYCYPDRRIINLIKQSKTPDEAMNNIPTLL